MIDLSGSWRLTDLDGRHQANLTLPGDGISALRDAGVIPDPYVGMNELDCRWVCETDWVATRSFDLTEDQLGEDLYLDIASLDTVATITINAIVVLKTKNCFRRYQANPRRALRVGRNDIAITFHSSVKAAAAEQARQPFYTPYNKGNCPIPNGNMLRKPQCHFGWDWNLALPPFGVYEPIVLRRMDQLRLEDITVVQYHDPAGAFVDLEVTAHFASSRRGMASIAFALPGADKPRVDAPCGMKAAEEAVTARFRISNPKLWWPAGSGSQPLYDLSVTVDGETHHRRIGLRTIDLITTPDDTGARFAFQVNGREVFCRGANWIPADALPSNATPELYRKLLQAAVDANMNMLRVWGGGFYETEQFYDLCDELGILVWQDAMFACHLYPSTPEFLSEVREELTYQARRLQHRACLALWCGDNELIGALTWFEESRKDRDRYLVNYDRLNRTVEEAIKTGDPGANWWPSSPSPGILSFADAWHQDASGDMHFWSVWHEGKPFEHYYDVKPRFCSEFGFQSYPSMKTIAGFAEPEDWNIAAPVFEHHQKNAGGNARITETMFRNFRFPKDFENFVYLSQIQHGLAMKTAIEFWRSLKPHCMGTLYWQLNDTWPVCSWSGLDHGGDWKQLHHMARRFFEPLRVVAIPEKRKVSIRAVNDRLDAANVTLTLTAFTMQGARREIGVFNASVPADRAIIITELPLDALGQDEFLRLSWQSGGGRGEDTFLPRPFKTWKLQEPGLSVAQSVEAGAAVWTLTAARPAFFVAPESGMVGRFSDSAFDLMPGESRTIRFLPSEGASPASHDVVFRHLHASFHLSGAA